MPHFAKKNQKSSIWPKLATFRANYHVSAFWSTFQQKVPLFAKKNQKSSIWPELATFRANYQVSAFWSTFQQEVAKSASFRQKEPKIIDLVKTCNFSSKLSPFGILVNFSAESSKVCPIAGRSTKHRRFGQNLQLFEQTITFRDFGQLFSRKFQSVPHCGKEHETSSVWSKLATFRANYQVSAFWSTFQQEVRKCAPFREKARKIRDFAKTSIFSSKISRFGVLNIFSAKSCKMCLISRKGTKNRRFGQNLQLFEQTITFRRFGQLFRKKFQKVPHFAKKDEESSIWPKLGTLPANSHVSAFWSSLQQKVPGFFPSRVCEYSLALLQSLIYYSHSCVTNHVFDLPLLHLLASNKYPFITHKTHVAANSYHHSFPSGIGGNTLGYHFWAHLLLHLYHWMLHLL